MRESTSRADERFLIGTCGYSYPGEPPKGWNSVFYPRTGRRRVDELEFYSSYFRAVEINSTFYRPPSAEMTRAWVNRTPAEFIFAVKAWQKFTHVTKLGGDVQDSSGFWERFDSDDVKVFNDGIAPLAEAGRLGALLLQYPAGFVRDSENLERLEAGLSAFERCPKVVELRHRSWSDHDDETRALLERFGAAWTFIDEPKFSTSVKQDLTAGGELAYLRLHGRNQQKWWKHDDAWERYDYFYRADAIRRLADRLKKASVASRQTKFYVFFNNHARGQAVANALMLQSVLIPGSRPRAPQALIETFPDLRSFIVDKSSGGPELPSF